MEMLKLRVSRSVEQYATICPKGETTNWSWELAVAESVQVYYTSHILRAFFQTG